MMMGLFFVACSGGGDIKGLVEKAKAESANWTEEQWKDAFREATSAIKPMILEKNKLMNRYEEANFKRDENLLEQVKKEEKDLKVKYKELMNQLETFEDLARQSVIGNKVRKDEDFKRSVFEDLGINPDDI